MTNNGVGSTGYFLFYNGYSCTRLHAFTMPCIPYILPGQSPTEKSYPNDKKNHTKQKDTEQRRLDEKIRMDIFFATRKSHKMSGNRHKYPQENTFDDHKKNDDTTTFQWNIVYNPTADLILTWTNQRVHIY